MRKYFSLLCLFSLLILGCDKSPYRHISLSPKQKSALNELLNMNGEHYNPGEKMLRSEFSSPGYHTTLTKGQVHRTRQSLSYAASCLDSDDPQLKQRGFDIIKRVIELQDKNPAGKTYGIWPWFLEEPIEQMSPPDWNWADFNGVQLLQAVIYHKDEFEPALLAQVNQSIYHAARSIEKRNVGPDYTNIAIMGTYVTMMTAVLQNLPELEKYALERLKKFYDYTVENGAFSEYNSPTYTIVALKELARMRDHFTNRGAKKLVAELYKLAWEEIAFHFHAPTRQWGGPHSRSYSTFLPEKTLAFIQSSTTGNVSFGVQDAHDLESHRLHCPCPKNLEHYFINIEKPRQLTRNYLKGDRPIIGSTFTTQAFSLGSINRGDFWNQRQPLIVYWGDAQNPSYLRMRFLHDGYDLAAAQLYSIQQNGTVIFGVVLSTDGGDTHVNLDLLQNAKITAVDLRLRFEFGGRAAEQRVNPPLTIQDNALLVFSDLDVRISIPFAAFDDFKTYWEGEKSDGKACYDIVLYNGPTKTFDLSQIKRAAVAGLVATGSRLDMKGALRSEQIGDSYKIGFQDMSLQFPIKPATRAQLAEQATFLSE